MSDNMPKLKPCPFCGGEARWIAHYEAWNSIIGYDIGCKTPGCIADDGFDWWGDADKRAELWNARQVGNMPDQWRGAPVFRSWSACHDDRNTYRVFHRDIPGRIIAEFYGDNAEAMATRFCELFGEPSGARRR